MFSFKNIHASQMGVKCLAFSRTIKAEERNYAFSIPGKNGEYDQTDGSYAMGAITIPLVFIPSASFVSLRQVAGWLNGEGQLIFDAEPNKAYRASAFAEITASEDVFEQTFSVEFRIFPFAESLEYMQEQALNAALPLTLSPDVQGTQKCPCVIRIKAQSNIDTLTITRTLTTN